MRAILFATFLLMLAVPGNAAEEKSPEAQKPSAPPPPTAIPVAEIATQATELAKLLRGLGTNLISSTAIETIRKYLPEFSANIDLQLASTIHVLKEQP
ncbi:MAG: hypothetical protein WCH75_00645, partial [Candidatus Binatia bacterium]